MTYRLDFAIPVTNNQERYIECLVNGKRYRYHFTGDFEGTLQTITKIRRESEGKALAYIKKRCFKWEQVKDTN